MFSYLGTYRQAHNNFQQLNEHNPEHIHIPLDTDQHCWVHRAYRDFRKLLGMVEDRSTTLHSDRIDRQKRALGYEAIRKILQN